MAKIYKKPTLMISFFKSTDILMSSSDNLGAWLWTENEVSKNGSFE